MKSRSRKRTPNIVNLTVKRRYLTEREIDRLMNCARNHDRYGHRAAVTRCGHCVSYVAITLSLRCKRGLDVLDHGFKPCDGRFATLLTKLVSLYARAPALQ